jgi:beta-galactosidase
MGGPINPHGRPHPEEVQILYHEQSWKQLEYRNYLWAVFIWNMFDFASDDRSEGDLSDVNEKGLVSYNRAVKKDAFYFYKANWSRTPTLHLVGRRYIDRPYWAVDVKAYSNAAQARLSINGNDLGSTACNDGACVWPGVRLIPGINQIAATAEHAGTILTDSLQWIYSGSPSLVRIKAGDVSGYVAADGTRYGSDAFFVGGEGRGINPPDTPADYRIEVEGANPPPLYDSFRMGAFAYDIPLPDGTYVVTARFVEPTESSAGQRIFDVVANGRVVLPDLDLFARAGGRLKAVDLSFTADATGGRMQIAFRPRRGEAVVSALEVMRKHDICPPRITRSRFLTPACEKP